MARQTRRQTNTKLNQGVQTPTSNVRQQFQPVRETVHIRCPCCGLQAREDLIEGGPYEPMQRTQEYGGTLKSPEGRMRSRPGVMSWTDPKPLTARQKSIVQRNIAQANEQINKGK